MESIDALRAAGRGEHPDRPLRQLADRPPEVRLPQGLALRYGKTMQCIAGIHYNFSLPERLWPLLREAEGSELSERDYQSAAYIALIRNSTKPSNT